MVAAKDFFLHFNNVAPGYCVEHILFLQTHHRFYEEIAVDATTSLQFLLRQ